MQFSVVTLFPELIAAFAATGIVRRAVAHDLITIETFNPRSFAADRRGTVDDAPYGGGPGMVMMVAPLRCAISAARSASAAAAHVIHLSPQGRRFEQSEVARLSGHAHLVFVAGRYEGIDERLIEADIDSEWSIGDYVLSGGEAAAMVMIEALVRTLPDALGDARSAGEDSFGDGLLDHPHYTRPETLDDVAVPLVLLSGDHGAVARWRRKQRLGRTFLRRPEMLEKRSLTAEDQQLLDEFLAEFAGSGG